MNRLLSSLLLLLLTVCVCVEGGAFQTQISAVFSNFQPATATYPYYDLCGWDCSNVPGVQTISSYCDLTCRENYYCTSFSCPSTAAFYGPFCYNSGCPAQFNADVVSTIHLRWGAPADTSLGQSGMGFTPMSQQVDVQTEFVIGALTHYNWPIYSGTQVSAFSFVFTLSLRTTSDNTQVVPPTAFTFPMNADETLNSLVPSNCGGTCPYPTRFPCSPTPKCADKISFISQTTPTNFILNGATYTLAITGMRLQGQTTSIPYFISDEGIATTADIYAVLTQSCPQCPPGQNSIFNQNSLTCQCQCNNTCPIAGQVLQPDCSCLCQQNCGLNAQSVLANGACSCNCGTGQSSQCVAPRIAGNCPANSGSSTPCCCVCPPTKCGAGTPNPNTTNCDCTCPANQCSSQGANWVASNQDCSCQCPVLASSCNSLTQFFNSTACACQCKPNLCPTTNGQQFTPNSNCLCDCNQAALTAQCTAQNRQTLYTPFDPTNPGAAQCMCGPCLPNYASSSSTGACACSLNASSCSNQNVFQASSCQCTCPAAGPTCTPPLIPNLNTCGCQPCTGGSCNCPANIKSNCDALKRQYLINSTYCGCGPCINNFTDTDPTFQTMCSNCQLTDSQCKTSTPQSKDLHFSNQTICECQCSSNTTCPVVGDIYMPANCSCRSCKPGECICGNGIVEAGEQCDNNTDPCCQKCQFLTNQPCLNNKCGICTAMPGNNVSLTCVDISTQLCNSTECYTSTCNQADGTCTIKNLDGNKCGDGNLCLRVCSNGNCLAYSNTTVANRCQKANVPICNTTDCCLYTCNPATGNCTQDWTTQTNQTCNDGLTCTINDTCVATPSNSSSSTPLTCVGTKKCTPQTNPVPPPGAPCLQWACAEYLFGQCISQPVNSTNVTCPASGYCSLPGTCATTGECIQPRRACNSLNPCQIGRCSEETSSCNYIPELANGLPCDDNNNCTDNDVCVSGACQGQQACNSTPPATSIVIPLAVTAAVVAAAALIAAFFIYQAVANANIMDPVSWGEVNTSQFDANPLYQEATNFGENPLFQS